MAHEYRILIGANGWLHPAWQDSFYPDDLPQEWRLGYYSNEFPVVMISAELWPTIREEVREWLEDCNEGLGVVCEIPISLIQPAVNDTLVSINEYINELAVLGEHLLALTLSVQGNIPELEKLMTELNSPVPVCLEIENTANETTVKAIQKICEKNHWPLIWKGVGGAQGLAYGQVAMSRIPTPGMELRQLREVVETILDETTLEQTSILIFDGDPPDIEIIRNANVILDLF